MNWRSTSLFLLASLLVGCSSPGNLRYYMPINRPETPEVGGRSLSLATEFSLIGAQKVTLGKPELPGPTYQFTPAKQITGGANSVGLNARVGIREFAEAIVRLRSVSPAMYGIKWQFKGSSRQVRDQGWKMGVALLGGSSTIETDDSKAGNSYTSHARVSAGELDYLLGYRESEDLLWYGVTSIAYYGVSGTMADRSAVPYRPSGWSQQLAQSLGVELACLSKKVRCRVDAGIAYGNYRSEAFLTSGSLGAGMDFFW